MSESQPNILTLDSKIRQYFQEQRGKLPEYKKRLAELTQTLNSRKVNTRVITQLEKNIAELSEEIDRIENNIDLNYYTIETAEFIQKYNEILKTPLKMTFVGKPKTESGEKRKIIAEYLKHAQKYYNFNIELKTKKLKIQCENCTNKDDFIIDENVYICQQCGAEQEVVQQTSSYKDVDRVNISTKYTYDRKVHFRDCINQYQGKQNCTIEQKVYDDLEDIFERHHLVVGKKGDKKEIRFSKITRKHVLMFLKELGYSKHYENVILIHYNITGKKPDDISYLEDRLLQDFDLLIETYDKHFKNKVERVNFISTQYVLYQLLRKYKHPCKKEDFVILKTTERKVFHDTVCSNLFSLLGWNFKNIM